MLWRNTVYLQDSQLASSLLWRERLSVFHGYLLQKYPWKDGLEQSHPIPLLARCAEMQDTCEDFSPYKEVEDKMFTYILYICIHI